MWTSKVLGLGVAFSLLIAACGGAEPTPVAEAPAEISSTSTPAPTDAPTETATAEPTEGPEYTAIVIDGQADDWEPYVNVATDRTGNADAGQADMVAIRAFNNDQFFYMAIYLADPSTPAKFSIALHTNSGGDPEYEIWLDTGRNSLVTGIFISGNMARPDGAEMVQGEVIELKLPLSAFGDMQVGSSFIHPDGSDGLTYNPQRTRELEPVLGKAGPTLVSIDGSFDDWTAYEFGVADDLGDASSGGPDLSGFTAFTNDKYLYAYAAIDTAGAWDDMAIGVTFEDGSQGQINLKNIYVSWFTFHGDEERLELPVDFDFTDQGLELRVDLSLLPAAIDTVNDIRFYNHEGGFGDTVLDGVYTNEPLLTVNEYAP
jgi:hypothetical protein